MIKDLYKKWYLRYLLATAAIVVMVLLRLVLVPVIGASSPLYIFLTPAIVVVAVTSGTGPGLFSAVLGCLLMEYYFSDPSQRFHLSAESVVRWGVLLCNALFLGWIGQRLRVLRSQALARVVLEQAKDQTLRQTNAELETSRRAALNLMEDAVAARERAEQVNLKLHLLQEKEKADAIRMARAQSAASIIRAMHEGVLLLELDGTIVFINPAVETLTGLHRREVVGRNIESLLPMFLVGPDLKTAQSGLQALREGRAPEFPPLLLRKANGDFTHLLPSLSIMDAPEEGGRPLAVLTLKDVTELHKATIRMEEGERKYRELVENANSIIMRVTPDHDIMFFNEYAQKFFGYTEAEVLGRNVIGTIVPAVDSAGRDSRLLMRVLSAQPEDYSSTENENICKDGRRVWVHWANRAVRDAQGNVLELLCVGTDITQRRGMEAMTRKYQERLEELAQRLAATEEEERWRISRYIHDTVIQSLSLSNIRMGTLVKPLKDANRVEEIKTLGQIRELLNHAIDECRMVMSDLTPALLYELGLVPALQELAQRLEKLHDIRIEVTGDGQMSSMANSLRGLLFESVRELIMNALKHAEAREIRVSICPCDHDLVVCVEDNGKGFDSSKAEAPSEHHGGFGLFSIRQRLDGLGGRLELASVPGKGTAATIRVPLSIGGSDISPR